MELRLNQADIDSMPPDLRRQLFDHIRNAGRSSEADAGEAALTRPQVAALLREVTFNQLGASLRIVLQQLAYADEMRPPSRAQIAAALPSAERVALGRYMALLNRLTVRVKQQRGVRLSRYHPAKRVYTVHPATRQQLLELLPALERSGVQEEPLWEAARKA